MPHVCTFRQSFISPAGEQNIWMEEEEGVNKKRGNSSSCNPLVTVMTILASPRAARPPPVAPPLVTTMSYCHTYCQTLSVHIFFFVLSVGWSCYYFLSFYSPPSLIVAIPHVCTFRQSLISPAGAQNIWMEEEKGVNKKRGNNSSCNPLTIGRKICHYCY